MGIERTSSASWIVAIVLAIIGAGYLYQREGGRIFGPTAAKEEPKRDSLPMSASLQIAREDHILGRGRYYGQLTVFHTAQTPVSGKYTVRIYGDVAGTEGQQSAESNNYCGSEFTKANPGDGAGSKFVFFLKNAAIQQDGLSSDFLSKNVSLTFKVLFEPSDSETQFKMTGSRLGYVNGEWTESPPWSEKETKDSNAELDRAFGLRPGTIK